MGWLDDPAVPTAPAAPPALTTAPPAGWWEKDAIVAPSAAPVPKEASGFVESARAGFQGSAPGLAWRGRMPDLVLNPETSKWWERAAAGLTHVGAELPLMIGGAIAGAPVGAPAGPVGSLLTAGAGMGIVPATIRQSLIEAYKSGEIKTTAEWFEAAKNVATQALKEGGINAAAMGAGALVKGGIAVAGGANATTAKAIGVGMATPMTRAGAIASETADLATQVATMVALPAAIESRMPDMQEFIDAAILVGGMKGAHVTAKRVMETYEKTGKTPMEQVSDAQTDRGIAADLAGDPAPLAEVPRETDGRIRMPVIQEALFRDTARVNELEEAARAAPLADPERAELGALRERVAALEAMDRATDPVKPTEPTYTPDQASQAREQATARLAELNAKEGALNDLERAERVFLTNATPEAMARHFKIEPAGHSRDAAEASARAVHDDVLEQLRAVDRARQDAGLQPLGDDHAAAVAALVRARVRTRAARLGKLPEEIYREQPLTIRDETAGELAAAEAAIPEGAPTFRPPETDLFGNPVEPQVTPRFAVENMETREVPMANLVLSKEVPQFKSAADASGVVSALGGKFDRTGVGPIQVWERMDGTLEVISGRHRLDLARRSGEETIPAQVHREAEGFDARQAATLDAQLNIREEQGSVADYAQYFKDSALSKEAADERGLLARAKGRTGFAIARDGTNDLIAANRAGVISDEAALIIAQTAPGSDRLQALGMAMVQEGKSHLMAANTMRAVDLMAAERMAAGQQGDIFGFDDSAMREAAKMGKLASSMQRKIGEQISAVSGASRRPELARKMGVDVQDPDGIQKRIVELKQEQMLWDNWPLHPDLVAKLRGGEMKQGPVEPRRVALQQNENGHPELIAQDVALAKTGKWETRDGIDYMEHLLIDPATGEPAGRVTLGWKGDKVSQLLWINTVPEAQKKGLAEAAVRAILEHNGPGAQLHVAQILEGARGFWAKLGTDIFKTNEGEDGTATLETYRAARPGGEGARAGERAPAEALEGRAGEARRGEGETAPPEVTPPGFDLKPETPAELEARNAEAAAQAMRRLREEAIADRAGKKVTAAPADLFNTQNTLFQSGPAERWYSELGRQIGEAKMKQAPAQGWKDLIKGMKGVKADEVKWSGVEEWLDLQEGKVSKDQVSEYLRGNGVKVTETTLGSERETTLADATIAKDINILREAGFKADVNPDDPRMVAFFDKNNDIADSADIAQFAKTDATLRAVAAAAARIEAHMAADVGAEPTKFSQYQLPGAKEGSYRELLLTLPERTKGKPATLEEWTRAMEEDGLPGDIDEYQQYLKEHAAGRALDGGQFTSSHFDEPNILAHVRFNERAIPQEGINLADIGERLRVKVGARAESSLGSGALVVGVRDGVITPAEANAYGKHRGFTNADEYPSGEQRVLFIEEIQSDWAQKGKKEGFVTKDQWPVEFSNGDVAWYATEGEARAAANERDGSVGQPKPLKGVPSAPFVGKTDAWVALTLKRMIRYAAENGMDRIAWTTGEQQVSRYTSALRHAVDSIEWKKTPEGVQLIGYKFAGRPGGGRGAPGESRGRSDKVVDTTEKEDVLSDAIGKAMADRIIKDPNQAGTIEGDNIKIDDTGMVSFYDRIVPNVAKDVLKKLGGGKVEEVGLGKQEGREFDRRAVEEAADEYMNRRINADEFREASGLEITDDLLEDRLAGPVGGLTASQRRSMVREFANDMRDQAKGQKRSTQQGFEITPAMKEKAMEGLPLFQKERASYQIAEKLITTMQGADKSSVVHELGHDWLEEMKLDAGRADAPESLKADWEILRRELAIGEDGTIERASHEQFARSVERYLADGEAPSVELRSVFQRFREWLLAIYHDLANLNVQINPELKAVLDRMLATDQEIADARELNVPRAYVREAMATEAARIVQPKREIKPGFEAEQASMEPYADELPKGPGEAPDNSHVNYAYINGPLDLKLAMQKMAEIDQANIQRQRGGAEGVKSWAAANAEQAKYLNDILGGTEDTLRVLSPRDPAAPGPDVKLGILKKLAVGAAKDSARLRDVVLAAGHDATVRQQLEYMGSIERARMIQAEFLGERAGVARALNALKDSTEGSGEIARMLDAIGYGEEAANTLHQAARSPADEQAILKAKLDEILLNYRGKSVLDIARLHKEIGTLKGTFKLAKELEKATTWEQVVEGWKAALLSGPQTPVTNVLGTFSFQALRAPVDALAAIIGMARGASPGMGESDRASMSEALARISGPLSGLKDALKAAGAALRVEGDPTGKTEAYRHAIPGLFGQVLRFPFRLMAAGDVLTTTMYRRGELKTLAIRRAFDEEMNPGTREFADRVQALMDNPPPEMALEADTASTRMAFNDPGGERTRAVQMFVNKWSLQWMVPFIRTPMNIAAEMLRMSPAAPAVDAWRADIAKGGVARDKAIAEVMIGSGIMALTIVYAFQGQITGSGSPDPGKNRGKAGVWQPNSVLVGDTYYEIGRLQPGGTLMVLAADLASAWEHLNDEEKDKIPKILAMAFSNAITNQTFLQGITNVVHMMAEPDRYGARFFQGLAGSMVPNVVGQPTAMQDPYVRQVNSMLEAVQARIPGLRQQLEPKVDWLGEPVQAKERMGVVLPVRETKISEDKVRQEAARLDISIADAPKKTHIGKNTGKLGDVELTPEERTNFAKVGGAMAHQILASVVTGPGYDEIPDMIKRKIFARVLTASHQVAAAAALPMAKRMAYLEQITEKVAAELGAPSE